MKFMTTINPALWIIKSSLPAWPGKQGDNLVQSWFPFPGYLAILRTWYILISRFTRYLAVLGTNSTWYKLDFHVPNIYLYFVLGTIMISFYQIFGYILYLVQWNFPFQRYLAIMHSWHNHGFLFSSIWLYFYAWYNHDSLFPDIWVYSSYLVQSWFPFHPYLGMYFIQMYVNLQTL